MSYNKTFFQADINLKLKSKLDLLLLWQKHVLDFLIKYIIAANGVQQLTNFNCFLQLLAKIRFNLEATNALIPFLYDDYRFKTSINLLYRSIIDDVINAYYLFGTVALGDPDQQALTNELLILHKEFLLSSIKLVNHDREFEKFIDNIKQIASTPDIDVENEVKIENPELFNSKGEWKTNREIRSTTNSYFINLFNQDDRHAKIFITEGKKLEFVKSIGVDTHHNIAAIFKYLSQYQHFSPRSHDLLNSHIEYDIEIYRRCLGEVTMLLNQLFKILELNNKDDLKVHWDALARAVFDSFSD